MSAAGKWIHTWGAAAVLLTMSAPSLACTPPPPMTEKEAAQAEASVAFIVYGEFVEPIKAEPPFKFWSRVKILHVYKGTANIGSQMTLLNDACMIGMFATAVPAGNRGYLAISPSSQDRGFYHFVSGDKMFRYRLIKGPKFPDPKSISHGPDTSNYIQESPPSPAIDDQVAR